MFCETHFQEYPCLNFRVLFSLSPSLVGLGLPGGFDHLHALYIDARSVQKQRVTLPYAFVSRAIVYHYFVRSCDASVHQLDYTELPLVDFFLYLTALVTAVVAWPDEVEARPSDSSMHPCLHARGRNRTL